MKDMVIIYLKTLAFFCLTISFVIGFDYTLLNNEKLFLFYCVALSNQLIICFYHIHKLYDTFTKTRRKRMNEELFLKISHGLRETTKALNDTLEMNIKLGSENWKLKKEIGCLRTTRDDYKKLLKEIKEELAEKEIDLDYLKHHLISETIADWGSITKEDWERI